MSSNNKNTRFLVVDDFDAMRTTIKNNLISMGFEQVSIASNGSEALKILEAKPIDCIISDWNMPVLNGMELLQQVRSSDKFKNIHFMLATAEGNRESVNFAIAEGVSAFIIKPFTHAMLRDKVQRMLSQPAVRLAADRLAKESAAAEKVSHSSTAKSIARARILVVDDIPANIDVIVGFLKEIYQIKAATSGAKALKIINGNQPPDLILLDIMMPEMDGMEVCRLIKSNQETQHIPVIFLTAKSEVNDITKGLEAGAVDYITKPANPAILRARVKTHLQLKRSRDNLKDEVDTLIENARLREDVERMTRHDIKNPLSAVINNSESLLESKYLGMEQKEQLKTIRDASYDMLGMINRSLDLYKMETGTYILNAESVDITAVGLKVCNESRINAKELGVSIVYDAPDTCFCLGEELLCFSMLGNLIRNAVEASSGGDKVSVEISGNEEIQISIHNQGVIPVQIRDNFFEKYSTANKKGGTGLGTYSARLMATVQGGDISYTSSADSGTSLTIKLPKS